MPFHDYPIVASRLITFHIAFLYRTRNSTVEWTAGFKEVRALPTQRTVLLTKKIRKYTDIFKNRPYQQNRVILYREMRKVIWKYVITTH